METIAEKIKKSLGKSLINKDLSQELIDFLADKLINEAADKLQEGYAKQPEKIAKDFAANLITKANELKL